MLIDLILDRKDGQPYNARQFYNEVSDYIDVFPSYMDVTRAMDSGTEADVQRALCEYVAREEYNPALTAYIRSVQWLTSDE